MRGEIGDGGRATRQPIQRRGEVARQPRRIEIERAHDQLQVRRRQLQDLMDPVHQLHVRIAAQLAEYRRALDGLVGQALSLPNNATRLISPMLSPCYVSSSRGCGLVFLDHDVVGI